MQANAVFACLPQEHIAKLQEVWSFEVWDPERHQVGWMTAVDTEAEHVDTFLADIRRVCAA